MIRRGSGHIKEVLMLGDSNTYAGLNVDGSASYDPAGADLPDSQLQEWRSANFISAQNKGSTIVADSFHPFNLFSLAPVASAVNGVGGGMDFMKRYKANGGLPPGYNLRITAQGIGGAGLATTAAAYAVPGGVGYTGASIYTDTAITRINAALAQSGSVGLVAILWASGANDAINSVTRADYLSSGILLFAYLRANITGASNCPIFIQPLVPGYNNSTFDPIRLAQADLASQVSRCGLVSSTSMVGQTAVPYHLDSVSQRLWGVRAADLLLTL